MKISPALIFLAMMTLPILTACNNQSATSEAQSHINRGETYAAQGQYRSAIIETRNAIQKEPENVSHVVSLAQLYNHIGAGKQASELLEPWLAERPGAVAIPLARAYVIQGKHLSASEALNALPDTGIDDMAVSQVNLLKADIAALAGRTQEAADQYRLIIDSDPGNPEATVGLVKLYIITGEFESALAEASQWLDSNGQHTELLYLSGLAHYNLGQLDQAADILTSASTALPTSDLLLPTRQNILALLSRVLTEQGKTVEARVYNQALVKHIDEPLRQRTESALEAIGEGDLDVARATLSELIQQYPDNDQLSMMLGSLDLQLGNLEEAEKILSERVDPETTPTPLLRAATVARIGKGKRQEALATLARAVEARPNDIDLLSMHGILALSFPDKVGDGIASISKALELDPTRTRLRLVLARHYQGQHQPEQALRQLRLAFKQLPSDWITTRAYLAELLKQGNRKEAKEIQQVLLSDYGDTPQALILASLTDAELGNTDPAIQRLLALRKAEPNLHPPLLALAGLYHQQGQTDLAIESLVEAATIAPNSPQILQYAARLYARSHDPQELVTWLTATGEQYTVLSANSYALAALVKIQHDELDAARGLLAKINNDDATLIKVATARLRIAEAEHAARAKDWATAHAKALEAAALQPQRVDIALFPVKMTALEGDVQKAMAELDDVEATFGKVPDVVLFRTNLLRRSKGTRAAYEYLDQQWRADQRPELISALMPLAQLEAPDTVSKLSSEWVEYEPNNPVAHIARASHLMSEGNLKSAMETYKTILKLQPDNTIAMNNLAWLLKDTDRQQALELAARANELQPDNPAILDTFGWILHLNGEHDKAHDIIQQALALAPDNEEIREHLETVKQYL